MNRIIAAVIALLVVSTYTAASTAGDTPSVERGKVLFSSTSLGTNGKSCSVCHPEGKGLGESSTFDEKTLEKISNQCIEKALKGKPLAIGSPELSSLVLYLRTLGPAPTK